MHLAAGSLLHLLLLCSSFTTITAARIPRLRRRQDALPRRLAQGAPEQFHKRAGGTFPSIGGYKPSCNSLGETVMGPAIVYGGAMTTDGVDTAAPTKTSDQQESTTILTDSVTATSTSHVTVTSPITTSVGDGASDGATSVASDTQHGNTTSGVTDTDTATSTGGQSSTSAVENASPTDTNADETPTESSTDDMPTTSNPYDTPNSLPSPTERPSGSGQTDSGAPSASDSGSGSGSDLPTKIKTNAGTGSPDTSATDSPDTSATDSHSGPPDQITGSGSESGTRGHGSTVQTTGGSKTEGPSSGVSPSDSATDAPDTSTKTGAQSDNSTRSNSGSGSGSGSGDHSSTEQATSGSKTEAPNPGTSPSDSATGASGASTKTGSQSDASTNTTKDADAPTKTTKETGPSDTSTKTGSQSDASTKTTKDADAPTKTPKETGPSDTSTRTTGASETSKKTTSASSPTSAGSPGNGGSEAYLPKNKKGITFNDAANLKAFAGSIGWAANWDQKSTGTPDGVQFYPMLWNNSAEMLKSWNQNAEAAISKGNKVLFSFNEPEPIHCGAQACMDPQTAADVWASHMAPYGDRAALVAPSISQGGQDWLKEFFSKVANPDSIKYIGLHWYEGAHQAEYFKDYFSKAYTTFGKRKIFVNEFAPTSGDVQANAEFIKEVVKWMDGVDYIVGYAAFRAAHDGIGALFSGTTLNSMGTAYKETK